MKPSASLVEPSLVCPDCSGTGKVEVLGPPLAPNYRLAECRLEPCGCLAGRIRCDDCGEPATVDVGYGYFCDTHVVGEEAVEAPSRPQSAA